MRGKRSDTSVYTHNTAYKTFILINKVLWFSLIVKVHVELKLPVAQVAGSVFVRRAACASTDAVNVLIAL